MDRGGGRGCILYDKTRRTRHREEREDSRQRRRVRSRGSKRKSGRKKGEMKREREPLATGRSKAQRREMHHLCSGLAALRAHHRVRVQQSKRGREREGGRESAERVRERERERGREREREGDTEKGEERKVPTDAEGRPTYIRRPIPTGRGEGEAGGREESQAESRWARSGLPECHTHRASLACAIPPRRTARRRRRNPFVRKRVAPTRVLRGAREWDSQKRDFRDPASRSRKSAPWRIVVRAARSLRARGSTPIGAGVPECEIVRGSR